MKISLLRSLRRKLFFTVTDVAECLGISLPSARVVCHRYVRHGVFVRLKKNFYLLAERWDACTEQDLFRLANFLQVPSYISLGSAFSYYGLTTQVSRQFIESVSLRRSTRFEIRGIVFQFYKFKRVHYRDFIKDQNLFVATKEKSLVDAAYLASYGRYRFDRSALDLRKLDRKKLARIAARFPVKTRHFLERLCNI